MLDDYVLRDIGLTRADVGREFLDEADGLA